jgi:hypothetical protein
MKLKTNLIKKRIQTNKQQLKEWKSNLIKKINETKWWMMKLKKKSIKKQNK